MPWASAPGSFGSTSKPVTPSSTASAAPPTRVATTGTPAAMDSSSTLDSPSLCEGNTDTETWDRISGTSSLRPVKTTRPSRPRRATDAASAARYPSSAGAACPTIRKRAAGCLAVTMAAARRKSSRPLLGLSRDTTATSGQPSGSPSSWRSPEPSAGCRKRESSTPFGITVILDPSYPSAMSHCFTASAFTTIRWASRHTTRWTRSCSGVQYTPMSRIDAMTTGVLARRAAAIANTLG